MYFLRATLQLGEVGVLVYTATHQIQYLQTIPVDLIRPSQNGRGNNSSIYDILQFLGHSHQDQKDILSG